ncbi:MAG TPA: RNA methyltransferase [Phycisphaerales bacterium]|nr:RNA methyltransferase [Phycisphaerales bacterium]HRQ75262.1 RNA methyltransferase [Phycisphaerales bacterium]
MTNIIPIESLDDPRVDVYRDVRDADLRGRDHLFMAESELVVRRLLRTPERLHSLLLSPNKFERLREDVEASWRSGGSFPVYLADVALISKVAGFLIHRGALAAGFRKPVEHLTLDRELRHLNTRSNLTLLLAEGITNVDNMGGLFRNAAAFGVDGVVLDPTCCDPLYRKAIRVSVGHTLAIPYAVSAEWGLDLCRLKQEWGLTLIGAECAPGSKPLWEMPRDRRMAIVFGSEAHGLHQATRDACDVIVEIPMAPGVPSLNVATAAAVFLYERTRKPSV